MRWFWVGSWTGTGRQEHPAMMRSFEFSPHTRSPAKGEVRHGLITQPIMPLWWTCIKMSVYLGFREPAGWTPGCWERGAPGGGVGALHPMPCTLSSASFYSLWIPVCVPHHARSWPICWRVGRLFSWVPSAIPANHSSPVRESWEFPMCSLRDQSMGDNVDLWLASKGGSSLVRLSKFDFVTCIEVLANCVWCLWKSQSIDHAFFFQSSFFSDCS